MFKINSKLQILHILIITIFIGCDGIKSLPSGVYASPSVCNLGIVVNQKTISGEFKIVNNNNHVININDIRLSCGCSSVDISDEKILPGKSVTVTLKSNVTGQYGQHNFDAMIFTDDSFTPMVPIKLTANLATKELDGTLKLDMGKYLSREMINFTFTTLPGKIQSVKIIEQCFKTSLDPIAPSATSPFNLSADTIIDQNLSIHITGEAPEQVGEFYIFLTLEAEGADWQKASVCISGNVFPLLSLPKDISLGFIEPDNVAEINIPIECPLYFFNKYTIEKVEVTNIKSPLLNISYLKDDKHNPKLHYTLQHQGEPGVFSQKVNYEFFLSDGKNYKCSSIVSARFL